MYKPFEKTLEVGSVWCDCRNISWNAQVIKMEHESAQGMNELIRSLEDAGITRVFQRPGAKLITELEKLYNHYFVVMNKNYMTIYWLEEWDHHTCPHKCTTNPADMTTSEVEVTGSKSFYKISNDFKTKYGTTLKKIFIGKKTRTDLTNQIKLCVPRPVNYGFQIKRPIEHFYMADVSGAYPYEGSKILPTLEGAIEINGKVEPNEDYPFAFYLESHHIKIYQELDTQSFERFDYWYDTKQMYNKVLPDQERTLLCKKSEYGLGELFAEYYSQRYKDNRFKAYMNLCIGFFQKNDNPIFCHISAIILARCAIRILNQALAIQNAGNTVVLIATDAVGWIGTEVKGVYVSDFDKKLGSFVIKYQDAQAVIMGAKKYQILSEGKTHTVWAGPKKELTEGLEFGEMIESKLVPYMIAWNNDDNRFHNCYINPITEQTEIGEEL